MCRFDSLGGAGEDGGVTAERITWKCDNCGHEHTPRCPSCRVIITGMEAAAHRCSTCANPLTDAAYTCPECQTERGLQPPRTEIKRFRGRGLAILGLQGARFLTGLAQMVGLFTLGISCSVGAGGGTSPAGAPSLGVFQLAGSLIFLGLLPVQVLIARGLKGVSWGTVTVGERRRDR